MDGSRVGRFATVREAALSAASVAPTTGNQRNTIHLPQSKMNLDIEFPPHPDLAFPPPRTRTIQIGFLTLHSLSNLRRSTILAFSKKPMHSWCE